MSDKLFDQPWFTYEVFAGIRNSLHGNTSAAQVNEDRLLARLMLDLLDREKEQASDFRHSGLLSFFGFCQRNIGRSQSQILQDLWVLYMTGELRGGYFVEFGACDGHLLSNTYLLEKEYDWKGILAEPNPVWHESLRRHRSASISQLCVAPSTGETVSFLNAEEMPELSRMKEYVPDDVHERQGNRSAHTEIMIETISLGDLLAQNDAPAIIDYLSVDTEGSEFEILEAFDFNSHHFRLITVEHAGEEEKRVKIRGLLESNGYKNWCPELSRWDDWYIGPDVPGARL